MDPIAHTLVGATLARSRLARGIPLALPTLLVAVNLPDVDIASYAAGSDVGLLCRRGWTHGIVALLVLPLLLTGAILAGDRWLRRRSSARPFAPPRAVLGLAYLGVATHPALDWLNTYGVRLLMPFDSRWLYGDVLFIVDPWVWLLLGGAVFLCTCERWRTLGPWAVLGAAAAGLVLAGDRVDPGVAGLWAVALAALVVARLVRLHPRSERGRQRAVAVSLLALGLYVGSALVSSRAAASLSHQEVERLGIGPVEDLMVDPRPGNPLRWGVLVATADRYHLFAFRWLEKPRLVRAEPSIPRRADSAVAQAARRAPEVQGHLGWARFPFYEIEEAPDGYTVHILDARYVRQRTTGFGGAVVRLSPDLEPLGGGSGRMSGRRRSAGSPGSNSGSG